MARVHPLSGRSPAARGVLRIWRREVGKKPKRVRRIGRTADPDSRRLPRRGEGHGWPESIPSSAAPRPQGAFCVSGGGRSERSARGFEGSAGLPIRPRSRAPGRRWRSRADRRGAAIGLDHRGRRNARRIPRLAQPGRGAVQGDLFGGRSWRRWRRCRMRSGRRWTEGWGAACWPPLQCSGYNSRPCPAPRHRRFPWWPRRPLATLGRKPRQGRKAATVSIDAGAEASWRGHRHLHAPTNSRRFATRARGDGAGLRCSR